MDPSALTLVGCELVLAIAVWPKRNARAQTSPRHLLTGWRYAERLC